MAFSVGFKRRLVMERWRCSILVLLLTFPISASEARDLEEKSKVYNYTYNHTHTAIIAEYASAVYMSDITELFMWTCSRCTNEIKGFNIIELIVDVQNCLQAFVGVDEDLNSIIISFRGTQENSIQNWMEDLFWKQLDLNYPGMSGAMVHHGFYSAYHNTTIRDGVLKGVRRAKSFYGDVGIIVTGHSMGGAMASFCALDLVVFHGASNVQLITFGQPRIGNSIFASCFHKLVPHTVRVVNRHDAVPHLPPYYSFFPSKTYHHFAREVWIYDIVFESLIYTAEKICDGSGEDPTCSRSVSGNSISNHLSYLGADMEADSWGSCRIVFGSFEGIMEIDIHGNLAMSKDPVLMPRLSSSKPSLSDSS